MKDIVNAYVKKFLGERKERLRLIAVIAALAVIVTFGVFWRLHYTGVAMTNEVYCGQEEHTHDESCYEKVLICEKDESGHTHGDACYETSAVLVCGQEETQGHTHTDACYESTSPQLICGLEESEEHTHSESCWSAGEQVLVCGQEEYEGHVHTDDCYQTEKKLVCTLEESEKHSHTEDCYEEKLTCGMEEHTHTIECMIDENADLETAADWEATLPALTGTWAKDVVAVAQSQKGYAESTRNFVLDEDGETRKGYTRYGAWYGNPYGDWDAMFASFCLYYAKVPENLFPEASGAYAWSLALTEKGVYQDSADAEPEAGDLIFMDRPGQNPDVCVGIVVSVGEDGTLTVIEGNYEDKVAENRYGKSDPNIRGYGKLPEQEETEDETETEEETNEIGVYSITYSSDEPEVLEIDGPDSAKEGSDFYFYVTVAEGYEITEVTANEEELEVQDTIISDEGEEVKYTYSYLLTDISEDTIVFLDATQVLNGSGSIDVYLKGSENDTLPEYTLCVTDTPTNTKISLNSPNLTLKEYGEDGEEVTDLTLEGNLYYEADDEDQPVSYLMLDEDIETEETEETEDNVEGTEDDESEDTVFVLTPYGADNKPYDMDVGRLVLDIPDDMSDVGAAQIWRIQTNTLCYLDDSDVYQQELIEAVASFDPDTFVIDNYAEGETVDLAELTENMSNEFYYGSVSPLDLTPCTDGKIQDGKLLPLDESGDAVSGVSIYMVYDRVYSFDVKINNVVNEHTEDNGDTYLWFGDTFYIDQYHSQGVYLGGYTECGGSSGINDIAGSYGVWPMLGRTREEKINGGAYGFDHWIGKDDELNTWEKTKVYDGVDGNDTTKNASGKDSGKHYGIVGPFNTNETAPSTTIKRVTGHIGDEFVAADVFDTDIVYMLNENSDYHDEWYNLGSHASDGGRRAWYYWITDFYIVNNYADELEYVEIVDRDGEVRLEADEIGSDGKGAAYDVWDSYLCTKRDSVVKTYMMNNQEYLEELNVGFNKYAGWPMHVQLRMTNTVETVIDDVVYSGQLNLVYSRGYLPQVDYRIYGTNEDGTEEWKEGSVELQGQNDQETDPENFDFYINPEYAYSDEYVQITVTVYASGTLNGSDGSTIVYDSTNGYLKYTYTLTSDQLREAIDCCPNNMGYDIALNLSEAVRVDNEDTIMLYKIWDDDNNSQNSRNEVYSVTVSLEYSTDRVTWQPVLDDVTGLQKAFTIRGDSSSYVWNLTLSDSDLALTDGSGNRYYFRIAEEQDIYGVAEGFNYTYTIGDYDYETGSDMSLVVMNSLSYQDNITGIKRWFDEEGEEMKADDTRIPDSVTIAILQDGQFYAKQTVTKENNWKFEFTDLPQKIENGEEVYSYTLCELDEKGNQLESGDFVLLGNLSYQVGEIEPEGEGSDYDYSISNYAYATAELPNAGGSGTTIFILAGLLMIFGSAYLLNKKRNLSTIH